MNFATKEQRRNKKDDEERCNYNETIQSMYGSQNKRKHAGKTF